MELGPFAVGIAVLTGCEAAPRAPSAQVPSGAADTGQHARAFGDAAIELQLAVAQGRLRDVRDIARWLADHASGDVDVHAAAAAIERAGDPAEASEHVARLGRTCSSCHESTRTAVVYPSEREPVDDSTLAAQMRRQQWAAARLWEGLIGPSDERWTAGARVLATTRLHIAEAVHEAPNVAVVEYAERLREQAGAAAWIVDGDERAVRYGELMATCAGCHSIVRPHAVAARPPSPTRSARR